MAVRCLWSIRPNSLFKAKGILLFLKCLDLLAKSRDFLGAQLSEFLGVNAIGIYKASTTGSADLETDDPKQGK